MRLRSFLSLLIDEDPVSFPDTKQKPITVSKKSLKKNNCHILKGSELKMTHRQNNVGVTSLAGEQNFKFHNNKLSSSLHSLNDNDGLMFSYRREIIDFPALSDRQ